MSGHSPLGASGAERWMNCAGSASLIAKLDMSADTDQPEYREAGTAAHGALEHCLKNNLEAWEVLGQKFNNIAVGVDIADAVQVFLDFANPILAAAPRAVYIEHHMSAPEFHPQFYGTVDFAATHGIGGGLLDVVDFKYGEGVVVEVEWNPQALYYAYGILRLHPEVRNVRITIVQPRIKWHPAGVVRSWNVTAKEIIDWAEGTLRPAMDATSIDHSLKPGEWCRFCPAKLVCPVLTHLFGAAAGADAREVIHFDDAAIGRNYPLIDGVKQYIKALEGEAFKRLNNGATIEEIKLVYKKANRVWKPDAKAVLLSALKPGDLFTDPEMKSPAEVEKLSNEAKQLVHEWAYTPESGLTVALASDRKPGIKPQKASELYPATTEPTP